MSDSDTASVSSTVSVASSGAGSAGAGQDAALAEEKKTQGNEAFTAERYKDAIALYTEGIKACPTHVLYANRAFAHLKTEAFGLAIADADSAIALDKTYAKAYYRRASAKLALGKTKEALKDFRAVVTMKPTNKVARKKFKACRKQMRREAFEKAIMVEDGPSASDAIDVDAIVVPSDYAGPKLSADGITLEFVMELKDVFKAQGALHKKYCLMMLKQLKTYFREQPSLIHITVPEGSKINVCGDTHGQYYDLLNIFELAGMPSETNMFLFNGDFVDRGSFSVENVMLLFAFKLLYPNHFFMSRGNHETTNMNRVYGFSGEVKHKYDDKVMAVFTEVFQSLPIAHVINSRAFVVHGGLPADTSTTLDAVSRISRFREPADSGLMSDLLWSDPSPFKGVQPSKRGVGIGFGPDVTAGFCKTNGLDMVIRSHEVKDEGYLVEHDGKCVTVFSAPNYCDQMGNKGAFITFTHEMKPQYTKFSSVPHPPIRPLAYASGMGMFGF